MSITQSILTTQGAANFVGLGKSTLEKLRVSGYGPAYLKLGSRVVYSLADLNKWLEGKRQFSTSESTGANNTAGGCHA